jgi:hypothetical protein
MTTPTDNPYGFIDEILFSLEWEASFEKMDKSKRTKFKQALQTKIEAIKVDLLKEIAWHPDISDSAKDEVYAAVTKPLVEQTKLPPPQDKPNRTNLPYLA